ncbi:MAG: YkgJ family cysteine cluster protein [Desulfobacteraceae bacterium]|nr:YkgJ family cysteine cluster protein [Desulfobacteraceae bacterium]
MDLKPFFEQYEALVKLVDEAFAKVKARFPEQVCCKVTCSDCCHALFDLSLVEAMYIKTKIDGMFTGAALEALQERANEADRKIYRIKRQAYQEREGGKDETAILEEMAKQRVRCPALDETDCCAIYPIRPITCRIYGVPTEIGGRAHTCGMSGFRAGDAYPTMKLDVVHKRLYEICFALAQSINTRYPSLADMMVPLSMAILTDYSEEYLGVVTDQKADAAKE